MVQAFEWFDALRRGEDTAGWEGTFRDYLAMVVENPHWAWSAHRRLYEMICSHGIQRDDTGEDDRERYNFFKDKIFGIDDVLTQIMEYFKAAAQGADVRRRILLLYGPPASGKSELVILLKRGLEAFSRTPQGALYAISSCPQHEDPLHLVPMELRDRFQETYGIQIEGQLCPRCVLDLREKYGGDPYQVPVKRIFLSEQHRVGIGTFVPSDPKTQDIAELVGSMDLARIGEFGAESDPRAYRFDGELNVANRGLMEFIEMLKADEKFLYVLLTLAQERTIKTGRFPLIYADEVIIAHTNQPEFQEFIADRKSEALRDRIIAVRVPYTLQRSQEVLIYKKLLRQVQAKGVHMAPHTLWVTATFAVLTRLEPSTNPALTLQKKVRLYDGQQVEGFSQEDVRRARAEVEGEGMQGVSPRFIINRLSAAQIKPGVTCLNPIDALRALREGIQQHPAWSAEEKEKYLDLLAEARREYDELARTDVQKAFFISFEREINTLLDNYLDHVEAYLENRRLVDPVTGEEQPPDERLMRSIEEKIEVSEHGKDTFRNEVLRKVAIAQRRGEPFDYAAHPRLAEALEKQLFEERRDTIKLTVSARNPDEDQLRRLNQVVETLVEREGYCSVCANELLKYVSSLMARES